MVDDPLDAHLAAHYELGFERDRLFRGEPRLELHVQQAQQSADA